MKKLIALLFLLTIVVINADTKSPWSMEENLIIDGSKMDGMITLSFKDAVTAEPIANAKVIVGDNVLTTDMRGYASFSDVEVDEIMVGTIPITVTKDGYITIRTMLDIKAGEVWNRKFLMSKVMKMENVRLVLVWGDRPKDLDLHLVSGDFHISYRDMKSVAQKASLDRDDTDGYGPETITLDKTVEGNKYIVYVHNYSSESSIDDNGYIYIYSKNELIKVLNLPKTQKRYIKAAIFDNETAEYPMEPVNEIR